MGFIQHTGKLVGTSKKRDADAVFAVYPFTPQRSISEAITFTPPTARELFKIMMSKYREEKNGTGD